MQENFEHLHYINVYREQISVYKERLVAEIRHHGLGTYRVLKDINGSFLQNKINAQFHKWDEIYSKQVDKNKKIAQKEASLFVAQENTADAQAIMNEIENILIHTLSIDDAVNWNDAKNYDEFVRPDNEEKKLEELKILKRPKLENKKEFPLKPEKQKFKARLSLIDFISEASKKRKIDLSKKNYRSALTNFKNEVQNIKSINEEIEKRYKKDLNDFDQTTQDIIKKFEIQETEIDQQEQDFYKNRTDYNNKIDELKIKYPQKIEDTVVPYCEIVLNNSIYPGFFSKNFDLDYNSKTKVLVVDYSLPPIDTFPTLTETRYISTKKELKEVHLSNIQLEKLYDDTLFKVSLRTIHELFEADKIEAIDSIVFNGWVEAINKSSGKLSNACILSLSSIKKDFSEIDLSKVDSRACFKSLKGVSSTKLSSVVPIKPIILINRSDRRFVDSHNLANEVDESTNLAIMAWEEFEHLIREIFQKEFSSNGGEVKVTQASRDGGVDAIAFDPDPIRGGKIVIQAKRYTNTVGVSSVRDLYGTVLNEGATKGILVTTSDYGPDAFEFAKNKPLTLMNGSNLLYLMEKHGHKARINILEAKKIQKANFTSR